MKIDLICPSCKHSLHIEAEVTVSGAVVDRTVMHHPLKGLGLRTYFLHVLKRRGKLESIEDLIEFLKTEKLTSLGNMGVVGEAEVLENLARWKITHPESGAEYES